MRKNLIVLIIIASFTSLNASTLLDIRHVNVAFMGTAESCLFHGADLNNIDICPASLAGINSLEITTGYMKWQETMNIMNAGLGISVGKTGAFGLAVKNLTMNAFPIYDDLGNIMPGLPNSDFLLTIGYGQTFYRVLKVGVNLKYLNMNLVNYKSSWLGAGLSTVYRVIYANKQMFNIGAGIQDVGLSKANFDGTSSEYPVAAFGGFEYLNVQIPAVKIKIGSTYSYETIYQKSYLSAGMESYLFDFLVIRGGVYILKRDQDKFSLGAGLQKKINHVNMGFDYAFTMAGGGIVHSFQLSAAFLSK